VDPINYMLDIRNPIEEAIKGYTMGRNDIAQRQDLQIQQQNATMAQKAFEDQQTALAEQRAAAAQQQAQAAAYQQDLMVLRDAAANGTLTAEMQNAFNLKYASNQAEIKTAFDAMSEPKRQEQTAFGINLVTSLLSGNSDAAVTMLNERIVAAENSGDAEEAAKLRANLKIIEMDPYAAAISIGSAMTAADAIAPDVWKSILDATQPKAAEAASPLGKLAQDVAKGILPQSVLDSALKLDKTNAEGGLTLKDKVAEEARLRGEYSKRTEDLTSAERNQSIIETSAADNTGAGDIALVTSFMKMLDPGSVVRETEFATAANAGGLLGRLKSLATKVESGQFLSAEQRTEFQNLSRKFLDAARVQEQGVQQSYQAIVDNYGLNPINVFGVQAANAQPSLPETPTTPPAPIVGGAGAALDFSAMTKADLVAVDIMSLTSDQKAAMLKRFAEVNAGP
jgi:hypothetical protein